MAGGSARDRATLAHALADAGVAAAIAALLALPLLGFRLSDTAGAAPEYRFAWVAYAAAAVFAGRLAVTYGGRYIADYVRSHLPQRGEVDAAKPRRVGGLREQYALGAMIAFAVALPLFPFAERNVVDLATLILIYILLATGLNITVGLAGLLDLGYVAFYAVGAYSYALLTQHLVPSFWIVMPLAGIIAAMFGVLLGFPVLRLRGDYLAIVTLGFGQIMYTILVNWTELTGGPNGISGILRPTLFGFAFAPEQRIVFQYYLVLTIALAAAAFVWALRRRPLGQALEALREDETASVSLGLDPTRIKLSAFALGAFFAGIAGALFATRQGFVSPESFTFIETALILSIVVLGGLGSQIGIVFAAVLLVGLPEWFRELEEYRMVAFGAAMVLIMLWRPRGLARRREPTVVLNP